MGKIFKTPKDDSVEETLRAMHLANTVDNVYEWGYGWLRTIIVSVASVLTVSATELYYDISLWSMTVEWALQKVADFGNWLVGLVS